MNWSAIAAIFLALAVGLGAFGAHGLRSRLDPEMMDIYKTAVLYHFLHALGMLIVSVLPKTGTFSEAGADIICWLLLAGILIFCGSLYLLAITGTRMRSEEHTSELQSLRHLVCRLLLEKKNKQ